METKSLSKEQKKKFVDSIEFHRDHIHVIEMMDGWVVKREGSKKMIKTVPSKEEALDLVNELRNVSRVYIHPKSGDHMIETMEK